MCTIDIGIGLTWWKRALEKKISHNLINIELYSEHIDTGSQLQEIIKWI